MAKRPAPGAPAGGDTQSQEPAHAATDAPTDAPDQVAARAEAGPARPRVHPALTVSARKAMRRAGRHWPAGASTVEVDALSRDEFSALDDDDNFRVTFA